MKRQLHNRLDKDFIASIFQKYSNKQLSIHQALDILEIGKTQFFKLVKKFKENPESFFLEYKRTSPKRISMKLENIILEELKEEKELIDNKEIPVKDFNYSYLKDQILKKYQLKVSANTITNRSKEYNFYIPKRIKKKHDREVITNYPGELIQHDSSHHKFSPYSDKKWYLITSIDDFSRYILYADLLERETTWTHILALESVILSFGIPLNYYVDSHSIFRFVQGRDSIWRNHKKISDEATPQWKKVLEDLNVKVTYALSPQAKGKIERPYRWIQDRLVRTCARENITEIEDARKVLQHEINRYNNRQIHSTTKEVPVSRFENALSLNRTLFRNFKIPKPFESTKDIFCIRDSRTVDAYHKISLNNLRLTVLGVPLREKVEIRIVPNEKTGISELRFWYNNKLIDVKNVKNEDIKIL